MRANSPNKSNSKARARIKWTINQINQLTKHRKRRTQQGIQHQSNFTTQPKTKTHHLTSATSTAALRHPPSPSHQA